MQVLLPLAALGIGWILILIEFGQLHQVLAIEDSLSGGLYALNFLQFWVFAFGVPIASILTLIYTFKRNPILGIINQILLCACAVSLGGCFGTSCIGIYFGSQYVISEVFSIVGLIGEILSLLSFFFLFAIIPYILKWSYGTEEKH